MMQRALTAIMLTSFAAQSYAADEGQAEQCFNIINKLESNRDRRFLHMIDDNARIDTLAPAENGGLYKIRFTGKGFKDFYDKNMPAYSSEGLSYEKVSDVVREGNAFRVYSMSNAEGFEGDVPVSALIEIDDKSNCKLHELKVLIDSQPVYPQQH